MVWDGFTLASAVGFAVQTERRCFVEVRTAMQNRIDVTYPSRIRSETGSAVSDGFMLGSAVGFAVQTGRRYFVEVRTAMQNRIDVTYRVAASTRRLGMV